jgi:c-di-GMP-related signal transduction protein
MSTPLPPDRSAALPMGMARQAILNTQQAIVGYELFDRSVQVNHHTGATDAQALFNFLSSADAESLAGKKTLFINCTHESLAGGHLDLVAPERVVLEIPPLPAHQLDQIANRLPTLEGMRRKGFQLSFDSSVLSPPYASWLALAAFIKFDLTTLAPDALEVLVRRALSVSEAQAIAEKVETQAQYQQLTALGVALYQGYWFAKPVVVHGQSIRPAQANILQLIDLVRKQASTDQIEDVLKRDPTLSFNLLRFINSAGFGARSEVTSFRHAVMLLGLNRLFKWAALLMTTTRVGDVAPAVGSTAVVRGRLMELLATDVLPAAERDNAFVAGVFSLLDTMLGMRMDTALASLALPDSVTQALLHRTGPLAPLLNLTIACETSDDAAFASAIAILGLGSNQVNLAHLQALAWAETLDN